MCGIYIIICDIDQFNIVDTIYITNCRQAFLNALTQYR